MNKCLTISLMLILFLLPLSIAQEIQILFPEDSVTYGPWSDTYFDYPRTGGKAHHIRVNVDVGENVAYYRISRNGELINYANNVTQKDAVPDDYVVDFDPDDLEPLDMIGYLSAEQKLEVTAYDKDNNEIGSDSVTFYIAVNLDDYYEILESEESFAEDFAIREEDLGFVDVTMEEIESTSLFYTVTNKITYLTVKNRFTNENEEHTRITITIEPKNKGAVGKLVNLYSFIPKKVVGHLNSLTLEGKYAVIDADPVMMWNFVAVNEPTTIEFDVNEHIPTNEISAVAVSDIDIEKTSWYFLIPLIVPIVLLFGIVYFSRFKKHKI
ncbi:hypothetical protein COV16_04540 [Candidatus Woesearchaeota archaeon CG10_big_fil_rev_8_21_14_0_10_34_8]|nr:MAG: hypothetical protein COV16_04540 [Candidatus Woesearchaeota archaeon CG10_big_fil_rev_8_21_14_0_10_34_8]